MTEEGYTSGLMQGMMHNSGIDPGILALMKDDGGLGGNNGWLVLLFLIILGGRGGFGNFGGIADDIAKNSTVINEANYGQLLDAIGGQGARQESAIQNLATQFGCKCSDIQMALASVDKQIAVSAGDIKSAIGAVSTQVVASEGSIKSAIQACCCNIGRSIDQASAHTDLEMCKGFSGINQNIQETRYLITASDAAQTANLNQKIAETNYNIQQKFCDQNAYLAQQFADIKLREDSREIQQLRTLLADAKATANTQAVLTAIANKDTVSVAGSLNTTAGTWSGNGTLS